MQYKHVSEGVFRVFAGNENIGMLSRYGIIHEGQDSCLCDGKNVVSGPYRFDAIDGKLLVSGGKQGLTVNAEVSGKGFEITIPLTVKDRLYGLGDSARGRVMRRGTSARMFIRNVLGYGPMPYLMSSEGWAIFVNCTYDHTFDIGETDPDVLKITAKKGTLDFYILMADSMKKLLDLYTSLTGRPVLLPKFAYGYTFVHNEQTDARSLLWDTRTMRDRDIACDTMGLEPSWMSKHYDETVEKTWDKDRFYLPYWQPANQSGSDTFFYGLREMGMQLSLWLCENYDLLWKEEGQVFRNEKSDYTGATIIDENFAFARLIDTDTKHGEPWFEHLKKFVDNGAAAFKLDGASQVLAHPDRLWGGQFTDDEVHNVYPVILVKQMKEGFEQHTDRRSFLNTAGAYAGTQQYAATWAGDTGGGPKTLLSVFNYSMCGHSNTSCDMDVNNPKALHYGFLMPWTQQNGWSTWNYPWFLSAQKEEMIRAYSKLRSSLIPYIYSAAHVAAQTGLPIVRPLPLVYEDTERFDDVENMYMLGDSLLVGAFDMHFDLPEGEWVDYFTGKVYSGHVDYTPPADRGGALFAKKGSVFVTMVPQKYILEKEHDYRIEVYPGGESSYTLYEDDGYTYDYQQGKVATTQITLSAIKENAFSVIIRKREGEFPGRPDNGHDHENNSIPKINGIQPVRDMTVVLHLPAVKEVRMNGEIVPVITTDHGIEVLLPAFLHEAGDVNIQIAL